jgi:transposase
LWHNLAQAVEKTVIAYRSDLVEPSGDEDGLLEQAACARPVVDTVPMENRLAVRTRERYAAIRELRERGMSISAICRQLDLHRKTVQRFTQATDVEQLLVRARSRASLLDAFKPYLHERFNAGHTGAAALTAEIKAMGYRGSGTTVRRYLHPFRATLVAPPPAPVPPSVRQVTGWLTRRPKSLTEEELLELKNIPDRSDVLTTTHRQVRDFADILTARRGERLGEWMRDVDTHGAPALRSFVTGLHVDLDTVTAGLTLEYNSGAVEGTVNRIENDQASDVRPSQIRPTTQANPQPRLTNTGQRQHGMCARTRENPPMAATGSPRSCRVVSLPGGGGVVGLACLDQVRRGGRPAVNSSEEIAHPCRAAPGRTPERQEAHCIG